MIHPTAIIDSSAKIGSNVNIGPYCVVSSGAEIGDDCRLLAHVVIYSGVKMGKGNVFHAGAVIGDTPQDLSFSKKTKSFLTIGDRNTFREHVTLHRGSKENTYTRIGNDCFLMAGSHVAHNGTLANKVILANQCLLAGHVSVGSHSFLGGGAAVHQFCRIGESVMVAGHASITRDVPPFTMVAERDDIIGLNSVGLRRRGFSREVILEIKAVFRQVFYTPGNIREVAAGLLAENIFQSPEAKRFLEFFSDGKRSFSRTRRSNSVF